MKMLKTILVCFIAGAGAGIGTGFAGMSAAAIIGPFLTSFLEIPAYQAVGVGLASDVLASAVSSLIYYKNKNLNIRDSLPLIISVLAMTVAGSIAASFLPERAMNSSMQIAMIIIGLRFLIKPVQTTQKTISEISSKQRKQKAIIGGCIVGLICGFIGAGGGMMLLFVLTSFLGYGLHIAVGTSVFIMAFTALTGGISHFVIGGTPNITVMLLCVIFTFFWARIAAVVANKASAKTLNRIVGIVMILNSIVILAANRA